MKEKRDLNKIPKNKMEKTVGIYPRNTGQEGIFQSGFPEILKHFDGF